MSYIALAWILFLFYLGVPGIAAIIVYFAAKGYPQSFDRETWWMCFVSAGAAAVLILFGASKLEMSHFLHRALAGLCLGLAFVFFGISLGCGIGMFVFKKAKGGSGS